jgi:hypothetical protein
VNSVNIAPVDSRDSGRTSYSAAEWFGKQRHLVLLVVQAYLAVQTLSPVIASNPARTEPNPNKWSPNSCHFKCDVELAVRRVIEFKPESERPALWAAWGNLLADDESRVGKVEERLIKLLSGQFHTRKLHPGLYFAPRRLTPKDKGTK